MNFANEGRVRRAPALIRPADVFRSLEHQYLETPMLRLEMEGQQMPMYSVLLQNGRVSVRRRPLPRRREGYALIRHLCSGICNTDLELMRGYYGFHGTPGHEFVGEVVSADKPRLVGSRVVGEINVACGMCTWCHKGLMRHCPARKVLGIDRFSGAFSEYFILPEQNLHVVPGNIPTEWAVFAEPLAAACEILDQARIPSGAPVAVLGDGKLGLLAAQVLQLHGAEVHLFGRHRPKLRIVEPLGVKTRFDRKRLPAASYDWVIEATGSSEGLRQAVSMTRPRGTVVMKSTVHGLVSLDTAPVVVNEITLVGSRCGRFEEALDLLRSGRLRLAEMIAARFPLVEARRAFDLASTKGTLKVLFV
jgi:threonine dehydrogenase-like Zn-dependent dehydrogenase